MEKVGGEKPAPETKPKPKPAVEEQKKVNPFEMETISLDDTQNCLVFVGYLTPTEPANGDAPPIKVYYESTAQLVELLSAKDTSDK